MKSPPFQVQIHAASCNIETAWLWSRCLFDAIIACSMSVGANKELFLVHDAPVWMASQEPYCILLTCEKTPACLQAN